MSLDYIIVQAGGKGTRLEYLTTNKPKALVPVNNLPMLFHLFKKFPKSRFVIIADYKSEVMTKYLEAFGKVKYLIVSATGNTGTCAGLQKALKCIPENKKFMLVWSDLVLPESFCIPENDDNYIGLAKDFPCRWKYEANYFTEEKSDTFGVAGLFIFKNKKQIADVPENGELVRWLQTVNFVGKTLDLYKTKEYGLLSAFNPVCENSDNGSKNKPTDSKCRPFNRLICVSGNNGEDLLMKEGVDDQGRSLAVREIAWYKYAINHNINNIPHIYTLQPLVMERINGHNVFWYKDFTENQKIKTLEKIVEALKTLQTLNQLRLIHSVFMRLISGRL